MLAKLARGGAVTVLGAVLLMPVALALPRVGIPFPLAVGTVDGHSMDPTYATGDVLLTRQKAPRVGDVARLNRDGAPYVHRIIGRDGDRFISKGDGNAERDPFTVSRGQVEGVVVAHLSGTSASAFRQVNTLPARAGIVAAITLILLWPTRRTRRSQRTTTAAAPVTPSAPRDEPGQDDAPPVPVGQVKRRDLRAAKA